MVGRAIALGLATLGLGCVSAGWCEATTRPDRVVDRFVSVLDESYAVFDARLGDDDWAVLGAEACADVDASTTDDELFEVLLRLARALDDGHVQLSSPDRQGDGWREPWPHYRDRRGVWAWVEAQSGGTFVRGGQGAWAWGCVDRVAYLGLRRLDELGGSGSERGDRRRAAALLDRVWTDTVRGCDAKGLVVDQRFDEGGWDSVGLDLARWIEGPRTLAWSTAQRDGPGFDDLTPFEDVFVEASEPGAFGGPVLVLTGRGTFSAGETSVLALRERPGVEVWGAPTSGHLSDLYAARLPKRGWRFTYSGDRYRAADGELYEARGIPVDRAVPYEPGVTVANGDPQLAAALDHLR